MSEPTIGVKFGTPPPKPPRGGFKRGPSKEWQQVADALRANPGEWAQLDMAKIESNRQAHGVAVRIRKGTLAAFGPAGSFEAQVLGDARNEVWARFMGDAAAEAPAEADDDDDVEVEIEDEEDESEDEKSAVVTF